MKLEYYIDNYRTILSRVLLIGLMGCSGIVGCSKSVEQTYSDRQINQQSTKDNTLSDTVQSNGNQSILTETQAKQLDPLAGSQQGKVVLYQMFTRLFGNTNQTNQPWGTIEQNGVGKFNDITDTALQGIKQLGVTHIWYTGVLHHAVINEYPELGLVSDDPDVVKGRAGSPYAIKDYYSVNPDLAEQPVNRLQEFQSLVKRTHQQGLKVIIDIVPNHVARNYQSLAKPEGIEDFGASDNKQVEYARDNNFYYVPGKNFKVPESNNGYQPLGGEAHPLADNYFNEQPAKWTGNGSRSAQPKLDDWYETVKINYGVRPDGSYDFPQLPTGFDKKDYQQHFAFWQRQSIPDSWKKFRQIVEYWLDMGIDGFRFDVAELVPVEFWSYLNSAIKMKSPDAFLLAEIYQPHLYRDFIHLGKMDVLYDKVDFYDTTKAIMQGKAKTGQLIDIQHKYADIEQYLMHFLENHDEQRIASKAFVGDPRRAMPAMVVSATISRSPTMIYFGQSVGEPGDGDAGFGDPTRTTIFDYWGVPNHQAWMNGGAFDGGQLTDEQKQLRRFYVRLLNISADHPAMRGKFTELHGYNLQRNKRYDESLLAFARWTHRDTDKKHKTGESNEVDDTDLNIVDSKGDEKIIVISNFSAEKNYSIKLHLTPSLINDWQLKAKNYRLTDLLTGDESKKLQVLDQKAFIKVDLKPLQSYIFKVSS